MRIDVHGNRWEWVRVCDLASGDRVVSGDAGHHVHVTVAEPHADGAWVDTEGGIAVYEPGDIVERLVV